MVKWSMEKACSKGFQFEKNDDSLVLECETILVHTNIEEQVFEAKKYHGSPHMHAKNFSVDTQRYLLWNYTLIKK
jgi:hypothetical protein